jgi:hypothetical protein
MCVCVIGKALAQGVDKERRDDLFKRGKGNRRRGETRRGGDMVSGEFKYGCGGLCRSDESPQL